MRLPNNLDRELVNEIVGTDEYSLQKEIEMARTASNSSGSSIEWCLGMREINVEQDLPEMCERFKLDEKESYIFTEWFKEGVRNNTSVWFYAASEAFQSLSQESSTNKGLATLMFIDTFNRADEVFDTHRESYVDYERRRILNEDLDHTPILEMVDGTTATVGDFKRILFKVIKNCGEYSEEEYSILRWHVDHFVETSTQAQRDFEAKKKYSEDEALALRWLTVGPMTDTISSLYATSPWELSTKEHEQLVFEANRQFLKMVIAWQLVDDYYDLYGDLKRHNINLVVGIMSDESADLNRLTEDFQEDFENVYPVTVQGIRKLYKRLTQDLNPKAKYFLESRIPNIFFENGYRKTEEDDTYYEETQEGN